MSEATSDAFLSGQGIPVELSKIEGALADLWGPAAEREGGPDLENPAVTRVTLANLVVVDVGEKSTRTEDELDTVVARYPCRAIVVVRDGSLDRKVAAEVSAICHLPAPGLPQVCSERILLRAGASGFDLVPGAIRSLLEADLPVIVWWIGDPRDALPLFRELAAEASRVVLDLPDPEADLLAIHQALDLVACPFGRDLSWFGITRWRELTAQFFDPIGSEACLQNVSSVTIVAETSAVGSLPRVAAWLAAWLAGQLGWVSKTLAHESSTKTVATFLDARQKEITVNLWSEMHDHASPAHLASVSLTAGDTTFRIARVDQQIAVEVDDRGSPRLPRMVHATEFSIPDRVSAALESAREDPPYRRALPHLIWLMGGS